MAAIAKVMGHSFPHGSRQWALLAVLGLLNNTLYLGLSFVGLKTVSAGLVTVIVSTNPLLTALLAHRLLGERLTPVKGLGLLLGLGGVVCIMRHRIVLGMDGVFGMSMVALGTISLAFGTILFKKSRLQLSLLAINGVQTLLGGAALVPAAFWLEDPSAVHLDMRFLLSMSYLVFVVSGVAVLIWFKLINLTTASTASAFHFLNPAIGLFLGWLVLAERVHVFDFIGIVPIALGILLVTRSAAADRPLRPAG